MHGLAVQPQTNAKLVRIGNFILGDQHRADRGKSIKRFADHPLLAIFFELPVASRDVVPDGITRDIVHGVFFRDFAAGFADHNDQLGFVVDPGADRRNDNFFTVTYQSLRKLAEEHRFLGDGHFAFDGVVAVVEANANDLLRIVDWGM